MSDRIVSQEFLFFQNAAIILRYGCIDWTLQRAFALLQFAMLIGIALLKAVCRMLFLILVRPVWMLATSFIRARGTL